MHEIRKQPPEEYFLGSIYKKELREKLIDPWHVKLKVGEILIVFKIDAGADINVISSKTFRTLKKIVQIGAAIFQEEDKNLRVIAYASCTLTQTEKI